MAFPTFTTTTAELDTAGLETLVTMEATINTDALLVMKVALENNNLTVPDPATPTDWSLLDSITTNSGKDAATFLFARKAPASYGGTVVTITTTMNCVSAVHVMNIIGWGGTIATHVTVGTGVNVATSAPDPPAVVAGGGAADNLFVTYLGSYVNLDTVSAGPTGWTATQAQTLGGDTVDGAAMASYYLESTNDTEDPDVYALTGSERCHLNTFVVAPGTAGIPAAGSAGEVYKLVGAGGFVGISGGLVG